MPNKVFKILSFAILLIGVITSIYLVLQRQDISKKATSNDTDTSYQMNVLVLKYFPRTSDGQNIDISVTGDIGEPYDEIRQKTIDITQNLVQDLEKATTYLGYKGENNLPALHYSIVDTKEYTEAVPIKPRGYLTSYPDYDGLLTQNNICDYVDNHGVNEVWLWAYQGPDKADGQPYLGISESKMSGPYGDVSNSWRANDMPKCTHTYRVYSFNYGRGTSEALESWGHQMEAELTAVDFDLFRNKFQGDNYPQEHSMSGRCGSVHNSPNARFEYDRGNPQPQNSDCLDWNPDSLGTLSQISCENWGCASNNDADNPSLNYMIWNWQNLPGRGNTKTYLGLPLRNWWDVHGDFDNVMENKRTLFLNIPPSPSPFPTPPPIKALPPEVTTIASCLTGGPEDLDNVFRVHVTRGLDDPNIFIPYKNYQVEIVKNQPQSDVAMVPFVHVLTSGEDVIIGPAAFTRFEGEQLALDPYATYNVRAVLVPQFGRRIRSDIVTLSLPACATPTPSPSPTPSPTSSPVESPVVSPAASPIESPAQSPITSPAASPIARKIGDANNDGFVDILDYGLIIENYEQSGADILGDLNHDGVVNILDFGIVIEYYER